MFTTLKTALAASRNRHDTSRDYRLLLGAEDRILRDIGVSRDDVRAALIDITRRS